MLQTKIDKTLLFMDPDERPAVHLHGPIQIFSVEFHRSRDLSKKGLVGFHAQGARVAITGFEPVGIFEVLVAFVPQLDPRFHAG
jgi:hypothetical protein